MPVVGPRLGSISERGTAKTAAGHAHQMLLELQRIAPKSARLTLQLASDPVRCAKPLMGRGACAPVLGPGFSVDSETAAAAGGVKDVPRARLSCIQQDFARPLARENGQIVKQTRGSHTHSLRV